MQLTVHKTEPTSPLNICSRKSISQFLMPDTSTSGQSNNSNSDSFVRRSSISLRDTTLGVINKLIRGNSVESDLPVLPINNRDDAIGLEKTPEQRIANTSEDNRNIKFDTAENIVFPLRKELSCYQIRNTNDVELGLSIRTMSNANEQSNVGKKPATLKQRRQSFFTRQKTQRSMSDDKDVPDSSCPIYAKRNVVLRRKSVFASVGSTASVCSEHEEDHKVEILPMTAEIESVPVVEGSPISACSNEPITTIPSIPMPSTSSYPERKNSLIHEIRVLSPRNSLRGVFYSSSVISVRNSNPTDELETTSKNDNNGYIQRMKNHSDFDKIHKFCIYFKWTSWMSDREEYSLFMFSPHNKLRRRCSWVADHSYFDYVVLIFISLNCITLAMERPKIPPNSKEREFLSLANYVFTLVFGIEMLIKVIAKGLFYGKDAYFHNGWNIMDGSLVGISLFDIFLSFFAQRSPRIFGILRVFRLLRSLRPLRYGFSILGKAFKLFIFHCLQSHQSCTWSQVGGTDTALLPSPNRQYRSNLLHIFHHFWHLGGSG